MRQGRRGVPTPQCAYPTGSRRPVLTIAVQVAGSSPHDEAPRPRRARLRPGRRVRGAMKERLAPAVLVAALLVATSAAFVVTEKLKLTRNPIVGPTVAKVFSPTCDCDTSSAEIRFRLRKADRVSVEIIDSGGHVVRELARDRAQGRRFVSYVWDGRDAQRPRRRRGDVQAARPPRPSASDDRDAEPDPRRHDAAARDELHGAAPGHLARRRRPLRPRQDPLPRGRAARRWSSTSTACARCAGSAPAPRGRWTGSGPPAASRSRRAPTRCGSSRGDLAGNLGPRSGSRTVRILFLALGRDRIVAQPGERFAILAVSQARTLRWRLGPRSGVARPGTLRLAGPGQGRELRAPGGRERPRQTGARRRAGGAPLSVAAQAASVVGCAGLVALYLAPDAHRAACRPRGVGGGARRPRLHAPAGSQPDEARGRGRRRPRPRGRGRRDPPALALLPRLRDARVHPAPPSRRHRRTRR